MSPGARTIPAAIVLPMAAEIPNHMPSTLRSRPRLGDRLAVISVDTSVRESVEGASDVLDNGKTQGVFRNFAMIMCGRENARRNLRRETHAIGNSYRGLVRSADKIPLAPCERFMRGSEIRVRELGNHLRLAQPLFVGASLVVNHDREGVEFLRCAARKPILRQPTRQGKERSGPRLDDHHSSIFSKHAMHFRESLPEILGQIREMVQAPLNDQNVLAMVDEGQMTAIADPADRRPLVLRQKTRRQIQALEMLESKLMESVQSVATAAKQLDNFRVARPLVGAQFHQTPDKFANLLFRAFKPQVGNFPRIGRSHAALLKFGIDAHRDSVPYERAFFEAPRNGVARRPGIFARRQKSRLLLFPHVVKITYKTLS